jgi:hypothetical protein
MCDSVGQDGEKHQDRGGSGLGLSCHFAGVECRIHATLIAFAEVCVSQQGRLKKALEKWMAHGNLLVSFKRRG